MNGILHPFTRSLYEQDGEGNVRVTIAKGDRSGLFTSKGVHISGDLEECDPQLCGWVAGPMIGNHRVTVATRS